jgi:hypothetical protein
MERNSFPYEVWVGLKFYNAYSTPKEAEKNALRFSARAKVYGPGDSKPDDLEEMRREVGA